jgi:pyruvate/2-oxoglutarate dehydrogenase complex dihydrolipoamide acyltransferase (E2) component
MLRIFAGRPVMHGLLEVDVTRARTLMRSERDRTGVALSFTAFLISCLARAVAEYPEVHAFRKGGRHLLVFDEVDVATMVEVETAGEHVPVFHVVRDAAGKPLRQIHAEIRSAGASRAGLDLRRRQIRQARLMPRPLRATVLRILARSPRVWRHYGGTVVLTSVGMFGQGPGWGLTTAGGYPLSVVAGGIATRPTLVAGELEPREFLSLTVSFDHTTVDGAPATRFAARLRELINDGYGLAA